MSTSSGSEFSGPSPPSPRVTVDPPDVDVILATENRVDDQIVEIIDMSGSKSPGFEEILSDSHHAFGRVFKRVESVSSRAFSGLLGFPFLLFSFSFFFLFLFFFVCVYVCAFVCFPGHPDREEVMEEENVFESTPPPSLHLFSFHFFFFFGSDQS